MKFNRRQGLGTAVVAVIVVVVAVAAAGGAYLLASSSPGSTASTVTSTVTNTSVMTSTASTTVSNTVTSTATSISTSTSISTTTQVSTTTTRPSVSITLNGAGSTFIQPVLNAMISNYQTATPTVAINYQGVGSGAGISALEGHTVDFAASDAPLQAADQAKAPNALTIPMTIGAVTVAYNLPGIKSNVHLTGAVVASIFAGNVTMWNAPAIASLNSNLTMPAKSILVVHRSDSSGTTFTFTGYLSQASAGWNKTYGQAKSIGWPVGLGANGNGGVAGVVQGTTYTIGYVELAYALSNSMTVASIQNSSGSWVLPTLASSAAAANAVTGLPAANGNWATVNLLNQPGASTYPIVTFSYVLVYKDLSVNTSETLAQAQGLVKFLWWAVHTGQGQAQSLSYVPLPANVVAIDEAGLNSMTYGTTSLPVQ
jgi:phosphate transport system substrate-binding protein